MKFPQFDTNDRGVSPVIGVILMVAITVILAAVIGTFVLNLGSNVNTSINAGVSFDQSPNETTVAAGATNFNVTVQVTDMGNADELQIKRGNSGITTVSTVGETVELGANATQKITVIGNQSGDSTVIQTYEVKG